MKQKIENELKIILNSGISINYNINKELYLGINFQINGFSLKWNLKKYLENFENDVSNIFNSINVT